MKKKQRKGFIYFRYILPVITLSSMLLLMLIPCYRYITADTGVNAAISLGELLGNSWDTVREYIFGAGDKEVVVMNFSKTVFALVIALWVLYAVALASAIYSAVFAFYYFFSGCAESRQRMLFVTLTVNRVVLCIYHALALPIFVFPTIMQYLYRGILNYHVELDASPFDVMWVAIALCAVNAVVIAISERLEWSEGMNVYSKRISEDLPRKGAPKSGEGDLSESDSLTDAERQEKNERILRLLDSMNQTNENGDEKE